MGSAMFLLGYVGPGGALSAIGAFVALVAAVVLAVVGFVWYPIKRLLQALRRLANRTDDSPSGESATERGVEP